MRTDDYREQMWRDHCVERRREDRAQLERDIVAVLGTVEGRRVLNALLGLGQVWSSVGCGGSVQDMAHRAGRRDAAVELLQVCNRVAPEMVLKSQVERSELVQRRKERFELMVANAEVTREQQRERGRG